jgi:hypothetical protein
MCISLLCPILYCHHSPPLSVSIQMGSCELEHRRGRWLAPTEFAGLLEEVYDTLLRQRPSGEDESNHIILGCHDSDKEIYCATERSRLTRRPFASTEEQAKEKLWMWLKKQASTEAHPTDSAVHNATEALPTDSAVHSATEALPTDSAVYNATEAHPTDTPLRSESILARTEVEAVEWLRTRGYVIAPPYASPNGPQNVGPPPSYLEHIPISMSQPLPGAIGQTDASAVSGEKRKRIDDWTAETTTTVTIPVIRTTSEVRTVGANGGSDTRDGDTDEDDDVVIVSAPLRKKRRNTRTKRAPQRPSTPPRRTKTKKTALSSVVSYEEAADLTGMDVGAFDPVPTTDVEGEGGRTSAEEEHPNVEVDPGEHGIDGNRTAEPTEVRLRGLHLTDGPPPSSSPEEEVVASGPLALRRSTPTAPSVGAAVDDVGDDGFISDDPAVTSFPMERDEDTTGMAGWTAESRRLYRHFCEDVKTAEERWDHPKTRQGMANLRKSEPLLHRTFFRCLGIARKTMGEGVLHEWRNFQKQGWEKRRRLGLDSERPPTPAPIGPQSASEPGRRDVVTEAYRRFGEAVGAKTDTWKARFQYRRAAIGLTVQYEAYVGIRSGQSYGSLFQSSVLLHDPKVLLRALFREMHLDWRNALPDDFTDKQARDQGYLHEWRAFNQTIQDGRRWNLFAKNLGLGTLLLIDTSPNNTYIQRHTPMPVFAAWTRLISRIKLGVKDVAVRMEACYDGMEDPSPYAAPRPLKLERHAYRACSPTEQFDFSGSEGRRTPATDPSRLTQPGGVLVCEGDYTVEDFIQSSRLEDEDFADLS